MTAWNEDRKFVLESLKTMKQAQSEHGETLGHIREAVAALRVKAGLWGLLGGLIPVVIALSLWALHSITTTI